MTAEFGGITGIFEADEVTAAFINKRNERVHQNGSMVYSSAYFEKMKPSRSLKKQPLKFFRADPDAKYSEVYELDLEGLDSLVALYPSPDNVVPVSSVAGKELDGVFIGACTTAEEDLILGALVLEAAMKLGKTPVRFFFFFFFFLGFLVPLLFPIALWSTLI